MHNSLRAQPLFAVVVALLTFNGWCGTQDGTGEAGGTTGEPRWGERGVRETSNEIMARDRRLAGAQVKRPVAPRHVLRSGDGIGWVGGAGGASAPGADSPQSPQTVNSNLNFTAATFADCSGWPPDTMGAVGPTQFIIALNGRVRSFNKRTGLADGGIDTGTDSFFSSVMTPGLNFTTDPRIRYDRLSGRWFIIMIDVPGQLGRQPNRVMVAMSDSGTITGGTVWTFFQFAGDPSNFADYPTLGIDANALYIGANIFSTSSGTFVNTTGFVVRKSSLLSGGPIVFTPFTGLITGHGPNQGGPFTPQGVDNYDPAATEGYFVGVDFSSLNTLFLRRVSNPGGTPSLSANVGIGVASFSGPINVSVQGTAGTLDGLDQRLLAAHFRNGSLWTSHNVGVNSSGGTSSPDRDGVRWYQIGGIPTGQTPTVVQSGTVFQGGAPSLSYWMGTIMVSGQGHTAMGFTAAGTSSLLNAATVGRLAADPPGTMGTPFTYTASAAAYNPGDGSNPHRWGDYSYTSLDPSDDMTMWTIQEWCQSPGDGFAVQVAQLLAPPPALPTNCSPGTVPQGASAVNVLITGAATNGAGFFDPGTGFSNRLAVSVNGLGVTVNSVTFNNPSHLTVILTVATNAALGGRLITVTNPDGQSLRSATNLLTIGSATNHPPALAAISNRTIAVGATLTVTNSATDPDSPPQTLTFSLNSGSVTNAAINPASGVFSWTPTAAQVGTNAFAVAVTDNGAPPLSATQSFAVTVVATNQPPVLQPIADQSVYALMTLSVTNSATDPDVPAQVLTFSLEPGAPAGSSINSSNGLFVWTPTELQTGTNSVTVRVTDSGSPNLSDAKTFKVRVLGPPVARISLAGNVAALSWNAISGTTYRVQFKTNLADASWLDLAPDILATGPVAGTADSTRTNITRFYRVQVLP